MSRAARREAERQVRRMKRTASSDPDAVTLRGGPMDGWVVKPDAPALQPSWREEYLLSVARRAFEQTRRIGAMQGADPATLPVWDRLTDADRARYVDMARQAHGGGRYVLAEGSRFREARWEPTS